MKSYLLIDNLLNNNLIFRINILYFLVLNYKVTLSHLISDPVLNVINFIFYLSTIIFFKLWIYKVRISAAISHFN